MRRESLARANKMLTKLRSWSMDLYFLKWMFPKIPILSDAECKEVAIWHPWTWPMIRDAFPRYPRFCVANKLDDCYRYKVFEGSTVLAQVDTSEKLSDEIIEEMKSNPEAATTKYAKTCSPKLSSKGDLGE